MSLRDFFRVVIKIFALTVVFYGIIPAIANVFSISPYSPIFSAIFLGISILFFLWFVQFLIRKPDKIINFFKLDKGFDSDRFDFSNANRKFIIEIACAIIGLSVIINSVPYIIYEAFSYFKFNIANESLSVYNIEYYDTKALYLEILYIIFGLLIINYRKWISKALNRE